jgi:anaerobic magnesium-protoporphyrin IX monomethyl ester cyclase
MTTTTTGQLAADATWVALVGPEVEENLSLRYLAASLTRAGFPSELHAFNAAVDFTRILASLTTAPVPPTVIGLSLAFQWRAQDFLALALALRERGLRAHITAGGHFATFTAHELLTDFPELDSVCRLEAEETLPELVAAVRDGRPLTSVAGLVLRSPQAAPEGFVTEVRPTEPRRLPSLDGLPHPDRRGEPATCFGHRMAPLIGSRGCYGSCTFCCIAAWQEAALEGGRFRQREPDDIAAEMVADQRSRGIEIFVFEDDNFFLPSARASIARIEAIADGLERRGIGRFATVVKARPNDVRPEVFRVLVERLHSIRAYVGIESDSDVALRGLNRRATRDDNRQALATARELGLHVCFNLMGFDPDTTLDQLAENVRFLREVADTPVPVGRVELYAGTPLLARMQREGRARGTWLQWDYELASPEVERVFRMTMRALGPRNFGDHAAVVQLWLLRFDVEACRFFHAERYRPAFLDEARAITRRLSLDSAELLERILARVRSGAPATGDDAFAAELAGAARALEAQTLSAAAALAAGMGLAVGHDASLTVVRRMLALRSRATMPTP